jgi:hypothetical protein
MGEFETIAEIAIALTGFTGIVTVLRERGPDGMAEVEVFRLKALLWWSLGTMFLALVPVALAELGDRLTAPWRVAHGVFFCFHGLVFVWFFGQARRLGLALGARGVAVLVVGFAVLGMELCVALGLFGGVAAFLYLVALLWFLYLAAMSFALLLFPPGDPEAS